MSAPERQCEEKKAKQKNAVGLAQEELRETERQRALLDFFPPLTAIDL